LPEGVDLVLLDYRLPDTDGVTVLRKIKEFNQDILVILLTAYASVDTAVEAMKQGAYHFANKPFNLDEVMATVERALETTRLRREVRQYRTDAARPYSLQRLVGESSSVKALRALVARVAASPASTVLLTGESGTGKDLVAKIIHYASDRASKPFMNITCSALPEQLLESELFGHERGAFTDARMQKKGLLEMADGGTVFLDEIGEMTPGLQSKLLRFLEEKSFKRVGGSRCRRCARGLTTSPSSWNSSSTRSTPNSGSGCAARHQRRMHCCKTTAGLETYANFAMSSNARCCCLTASASMRKTSRSRRAERVLATISSCRLPVWIWRHSNGAW
jgi:DNA-binding NtrC family response regulator